MAKSVSYAVSSRGPLGPRDDIGRGWYGLWYRFCHVLYALSYSSTGDYIWTAFWSLEPGLHSVLLLSCFKDF